MRRRTRFCELCQKPSNVRFCSYECRDTDRSNTAIKRSELGIQKASATVYRSYLIRTKGAKCMKCGWSEINPKSGKVPIQLNHINGNSEDNKLSNLELLCPNCHSLTPTFGMLNKGNGRKKRRDRYQQEKLAA